MTTSRFYKAALAVIAVIAALTAPDASAQIITTAGAHRALEADTVVFLPWFDEELTPEVCLLDSLDIPSIRPVSTIPAAEYRPVVFDTWKYLDTLQLTPAPRPKWTNGAFDWIDDIRQGTLLLENARQSYMNRHPESVAYNVAWLPVPPDEYNATVATTTTRLDIGSQEVGDRRNQVATEVLSVTPTHWIHNLNTSVQFSQAYVSPNWYQGGNKSLIMLVNAVYNVKLNQKFHPKLLFESTVSYKLGTNSAPDDSVRSYNISEDLFQINSNFGYKAHKRWYYSVNLLFKTQLFNAYKSNSTQRKSAFLSPGELNIGLGMTYNYDNKPKTFTCNAAINPLSWQLRTCIDNTIDETAYEIKPGRNAVSQYGSSIDATMTWKIAYNIVYTTRMFIFSDYSNFQGDWENTISFNINRFLSTQIYAHLRYDTSTPRCDDPSWHKLQFKEVLSFGFAYRFSNI